MHVRRREWLVLALGGACVEERRASGLGASVGDGYSFDELAALAAAAAANLFCVRVCD